MISQAAREAYTEKLWDKNGQDPKVIGNSFNGDQIYDEHAVGKPTTINGRYLTWKIRKSRGQIN